MADKIHEFLSLLKNVKQNGSSGWTALCPAHGDTENSLSVSEGDDGRILVNCFAGCEARSVAEAVGWKLSDLFAETDRLNNDAAGQGPRKAVTGPAITIADLARDKGLPVEFLKFYCEQLPFGVKIIYKNMDGRPSARQRLRTALKAKEGSKWIRGAGSPNVYGIWRVARMAEEAIENGHFLLLVEGETDAWTAWLHKMPALGIPGADMAGKLAKSYVEPFPRILIWQEPDSGGETFVNGVSQRLAELGYKGQVAVIQGPRDERDERDEKTGYEKTGYGKTGYITKDLNELHKNLLHANAGDLEATKVHLKEAWQIIVSQARPVDLSEIIEVKKPLSRDKAILSLDPALAFHNLTDMGNADRLTTLFGKEILYCYPWSSWLIWNGKHWQRDESGEIDRRAEATVRSIYAEAADVEDRERRYAIVKHARQSEAVARVKAMIDRAKNRVPVMPDELDGDLFIFNCKNGTIDLRTGELKKHDRRDLITKMSPAEYRESYTKDVKSGNFDLEAAAPLWHKFLCEVTGDDFELMSFLQRAAGYALTGDTSEHCLFFLHGDGRNGKSVFLNVLEHVLGDYGSVARPDVLMAKRYGEGIPNEIAALTGVRYVSTTETGAGKRFAEAMLKQYTGGDTISARFLHAEFFTFKPQFKIFLASNNKPIIRGQDVAIWERIYLIPFTVFIPPEERDKQLTRKLRAEADGILAWAVAGCLEWGGQIAGREAGLNPPAAVRAATEEYRQEMDMLGEFIEDCCYLNATARATNAAIRSAYEKWCLDNGEKYPINQREFKAEMERRGIEAKRTSHVRYYLGIGLLVEGREEQGTIGDDDDGLEEKTGQAEEQKNEGGFRKHVNHGENSYFDGDSLY